MAGFMFLKQASQLGGPGGRGYCLFSGLESRGHNDALKSRAHLPRWRAKGEGGKRWRTIFVLQTADLAALAPRSRCYE